MKILFVLTYYHPHCSGLTVYVQRLARALAARGHSVTVLTSQYSQSLPREEFFEQARIVRAPVLFRVSKGVVMPAFPFVAYPLIKESDVVSIHLPQMEGALVAFLSRLAHKRVVLTYHCDLRLPSGILNRIADQMIGLVHFLAGVLSNQIVAYTHDYAEHSPFLSKFPSKTIVIYPPIEIPHPTPSSTLRFQEKHNLNGRQIIGYAGRVAEEKGLEYLIKAIPLLVSSMPDALVVFAGEYLNVIGEKVFQKLEPVIDEYRDRLLFLGLLGEQDMADFFSACEVLVLPSLNSTESFGLVQVESMLCGTPVVATTLPGVREAIRVTGMGKLIPPRDEHALANAVVDVVQDRIRYVKPRSRIEEVFSLTKTIDQYERLFQSQ